MHRYLLAVDDSPEAQAAARWLGELCRADAEAEVVVAHVFEPAAYYARVRGTEEHLRPLDEAMVHDGSRVFARVLPVLGVPARTLVRIGRPETVIPQLAEELGATAIVFGRHAKVGLRRLRLFHAGLVERVEQGAPCPVVAVAA